MRKRKKFSIPSKYLLLFLTLLCIGLMLLTFTTDMATGPLRTVSNYVFVPIQKGINQDVYKRQEPTEVGADLCVGSLIKNPGGGLAPIGGYIVGKQELIENCAYRLTSPGLGKEVGATLGILNSFYQGFFLAPTVTASALKGAVFAANVYEALGFSVLPNACLLYTSRCV